MQRWFSLPFGVDAYQIALAAESIEAPKAAVATDDVGAIQEALEHPVGCPPLGQIVRPGETVAVVVNDVTRLTRSDRFLPPLVNTLNRAGIPDGDIFIVFALGTHRAQTEAEQRALVGEEIFRRIRVFDHDGGNDRNLVTIGATSAGNKVEINRRVWEADRIVLTGDILFHRIAGYSGGRKSLAPGVAGNRTTTFNHRMVLDPRCQTGVLDGNPAHEDLLEACRLADPDFILNVVLSPEGKLLHVVAGELEEAHREGCRAADRLLRTPIGHPFDLIIGSTGGAPLDIDLRQAQKGMDNACAALRDGGTLFYYAECPDGLGSPMLDRYLRRYGSAEEMERTLREDFVIGGHKALWLSRLGQRYDVHLVTHLDSFFVERCGFHAVRPEEHDQYLKKLLGRLGPARIGVIPHAGLTFPVVQEAGGEQGTAMQRIQIQA
jgi:nickel-dependent lactate racemase